MSDQNGFRGGPPQEESAYPPPPGEEEEERQRQPHQYPPPPGAAHMTLPPIQDAHPAYARYAPGPPSDPRSQGHYAASPTGANGHAPPPGYQLPPVQPPPDQRYGVEPRYDYAQPRQGGSFPPAPPPPADHYNYTYRPSSGSPYGAPGGPYEYGRAPAAPAQAAPRQRTSIACSYCRRRKIRCSGYGTSDGVCSNCRKTGNKCVFQPVSNAATTAFVPVSAIPGGVAPGTPLYGAFGQPLPQGPGDGRGGPPLPPPPHGAAGAQGYAPHQGMPDGYQGHSPRSSFYPPPPEDANSRRRQNDEDHTSRLPPPSVYGDPDPRRRSPASPMQTTPPQEYNYGTNYESSDRAGTPRRDSPSSPQQGGNGAGANAMSLNALIESGPPPRPPPNADDSREIDRNMLSRLNRRT
ncbi:unnamed protein product [Discula destructiva]